MAENNPQDEQSEMQKEKTIDKVFNDSVHGHIEMHPLLVKIIDTPEFQRLRNIKQFAGGYYVYPGASHNRFEHCIGVAHLAGKLVQSLRDRQPNLKITEIEKLCVQIAGLCHDLGHGPFSHAFDDFMEVSKKPWKHEEQSVKMFNHLIKGHIKNIMETDYGFKQNDFKFIEELINPPKSYKHEPWEFKGRTRDKSFLYEIVANKLTGIDVDKMDYFSRDCHHLGMTSNFSHERYMMFARVCTDSDGNKRICMRDKEAMNMYELFHVRNQIHQRACHHRVAKAVELMITDALIAAEGHFKLGEKQLTISEAVDDLDTFTHLTDDILQEILRSNMTELSRSHEIIKRITERDLYRFFDGGLFKCNEVERLDTDGKRKELLKKWIKKITKQNLSREEKMLMEWIDKRTQQPKLSAEDFRIVFIDLTYGMKESNPIDSMPFYKKNQPDKPYKLKKTSVSHILPEEFAETRVMLFYKGLPKKHVKTLWEELQEPVAEEEEPSDGSYNSSDEIYKDLTGPDDTTSLTSQKIINIFSEYENGIYQFFDEKTFEQTKLEHLTRPEQWKVKLDVWLTNVKEQPDGKKPDLELNDFKMVSYRFQDQSNIILIKVMLFYKGVSENDVKEFWDLVKTQH